MEFDEYEYLEKAVDEKVETESKKGREKQREKEVVDDDRRRRRGEEEEESNGGGRERKRREKDGRREKEERDRGDRRDRDRDRDRKEREREKEKERERERRERRSSSRSRHEREKEREREREKELRERDIRRFKEKKEAEPVADPERDQRTVFAYQMPLKATERDVFEFFSKAGKVRDVRLIMDRNSRRSKGVGYIEFVDVMTVPMAIAMSGQLLLGQPVMVKPSEAEKNLVQPTPSAGSSAGPIDRKLYVGNLHYNMTEQQLRQIFEPFGPVELIQLPLDPDTGHCKGFGFVQFAQAEHAKTAVSLNGKLDIAGRCIKVSSVADHVGAQEGGTAAADFDDDDGGGLSLNAQSRALLMQKLDRTGTTTSIGGTMGVPMGNGSVPTPTLSAQVLPTAVAEPVGTPSECLLLKNLFDPSIEADPEFDLDIKDDVSEECSKFGEVKHIYVDKHSAGHVYLRFANKEAAMNAQRQMHLRWFAQKLISAVFMPPQDYDAKFRDSA